MATRSIPRLAAPLAETIENLRALQAPDGSIPETKQQFAAGAVDRIVALLAAAPSLFPHETAYLNALEQDFRDWRDADYPKPDFFRSLQEFRPHEQRQDGLHWLILFPLYTPNASLDTRFELLLTQAPWPAWLARLEALPDYRNAGFVPMRTIVNTSGYDSACAVLFPEMVAIGDHAASEAPNGWGTIFCDKEAARFRSYVAAAATHLNEELPPTLRRLLNDPGGAEDAFLLWDMIHDRTHMQGSMPFDPFMVRQRHPYWMYSIEELRCDITAMTELDRLDHYGLSPVGEAGPHVVLLDRMLRFPVTGSRVRNYDGLAGQILFGVMQSAGAVETQGEVLHVDWGRVPQAAWHLRDEIEALYEAGSTQSQPQHWLNGWDFVAKYVDPTPDSKIPTARRSAKIDRADVLGWVANDEFPLHTLYKALPAARQRTKGKKASAVLPPVVPQSLEIGAKQDNSGEEAARRPRGNPEETASSIHSRGAKA